MQAQRLLCEKKWCSRNPIDSLKNHTNIGHPRFRILRSTSPILRNHIRKFLFLHFLRFEGKDESQMFGMISTCLGKSWWKFCIFFWMTFESHVLHGVCQRMERSSFSLCEWSGAGMPISTNSIRKIRSHLYYSQIASVFYFEKFSWMGGNKKIKDELWELFSQDLQNGRGKLEE